jgi:hypothetical protein
MELIFELVLVFDVIGTVESELRIDMQVVL